MPDFGEFANEAEKLAGEHKQQSDEAIQKAGQVADKETGNRFDSEIQQGEQRADQYLDQGGQSQGQQ